jgi:hypothetical protein
LNAFDSVFNAHIVALAVRPWRLLKIVVSASLAKVHVFEIHPDRVLLHGIVIL